jgi:hypothetical protein
MPGRVANILRAPVQGRLLNRRNVWNGQGWEEIARLPKATSLVQDTWGAKPA